MRASQIFSTFLFLALASNAHAETVTTTDGRKIELKKNGTYEILGSGKSEAGSTDLSDAGGGFKYGKVKCSVSMGAIVECLTRIVGDKTCSMATFTLDLLEKDGSPIGQGNCVLSSAKAGTPVVLSCTSQGTTLPNSVALHFAHCI